MLEAPPCALIEPAADLYLAVGGPSGNDSDWLPSSLNRVMLAMPEEDDAVGLPAAPVLEAPLAGGVEPLPILAFVRKKPLSAAREAPAPAEPAEPAPVEPAPVEPAPDVSCTPGRTTAQKTACDGDLIRRTRL